MKSYSSCPYVNFVLDDNGNSLTSNFTMAEYADMFTAYDIYQGIVGDCFLIAAIMGITRNKTLLSFLIPVDNSNTENINKCAYHFRLWKLGDWFDVVIDDYLPVNEQHQLLFARNLTYPNEFWIPLFEKAIAK